MENSNPRVLPRQINARRLGAQKVCFVKLTRLHEDANKDPEVPQCRNQLSHVVALFLVALIYSKYLIEQQILILARQQAQREEELAQSQRHILALQEEIEELEHENRLHSQQEALLKTELRDMERMHRREGVDMTYLKNVVLKLLETGEAEALLPVIGMLLQFSEIQKCPLEMGTLKGLSTIQIF